MSRLILLTTGTSLNMRKNWVNTRKATLRLRNLLIGKKRGNNQRFLNIINKRKRYSLAEQVHGIIEGTHKICQAVV